MSNNKEDLDLLLSLQDRVLETPPSSPSNSRPSSPAYLSDDGSVRRNEDVDMSVFRNAVEDCMDYRPENAKKDHKSNQPDATADPHVEKFSGLRIRNQLVSSAELKERFSDIRFVRLQVIKNLLVGDNLSGCWATVGVLTEKGARRTSSAGKDYCIWKLGSLNEDAVSLFLFGEAYQRNSHEKAGAVFALFNCNVREDSVGGFSLSVYSPTQILKIGTSVDYGVCKAKRRDGSACTLVINRRLGTYCRYHKSKASDKYTDTRIQLNGGNLKTAFRNPLHDKGIYCVNPLSDRTNFEKAKRPQKLLSVEGLKKALSGAGKVTTSSYSQGLRFLTEVTAKMESKSKSTKFARSTGKFIDSTKRKSPTGKVDTSLASANQQIGTKRKQMEQTSADKAKPVSGKLIELEIFSSDDEL